jgi:hypothetical protein
MPCQAAEEQEKQGPAVVTVHPHCRVEIRDLTTTLGSSMNETVWPHRPWPGRQTADIGPALHPDFINELHTGTSYRSPLIGSTAALCTACQVAVADPRRPA